MQINPLSDLTSLLTDYQLHIGKSKPFDPTFRPQSTPLNSTQQARNVLPRRSSLSAAECQHPQPAYTQPPAPSFGNGPVPYLQPPAAPSFSNGSVPYPQSPAAPFPSNRPESDSPSPPPMYHHIQHSPSPPFSR